MCVSVLVQCWPVQSTRSSGEHQAKQPAAEEGFGLHNGGNGGSACKRRSFTCANLKVGYFPHSPDDLQVSEGSENNRGLVRRGLLCENASPICHMALVRTN